MAWCRGLDLALRTGLFRSLHDVIRLGLIRSCHDLSEGGVAVALAEMALAGGIGAVASLRYVPRETDEADPLVLLFSESPTRFVLEVAPEDCPRVEERLAAWPLGRLGEVGPRRHAAAGSRPVLTIEALDGSIVVDAPLEVLKQAWQEPLRWS